MPECLSWWVASPVWFEIVAEKENMTLIVGLISLALLIYLFIAMIWPEKF
jgi:K+-transporting ATPase KdpF subunit